MSTIDNHGTTHETRTFSYEDPAAPHGITTWWGWECTCGKTNSGVDRVFAQDLARTHEERVAACTCGNPVLSIAQGRSHRHGYLAVASVACDCGTASTARIPYYSNGRISNQRSAFQSARRVALNLHHEHKCHRLALHDHHHPEPTVSA